MTKLEFLKQLRNKLSGLPQDEVEERVIFYREMIEDRMEEGLSEEEAVAAIGAVDEITAQTIADTSPAKRTTHTLKPKRRLNTWEIVLIVLGFPIWFSLGIAAVSVVFSLYAVLWSVIISLWAVFVAFACCSFAGILAGIVFACQKNALQGIAVIGASIVCAGLSIFMFCGCNAVTKGIVALTKNFVFWLKRLCLKKGVA